MTLFLLPPYFQLVTLLEVKLQVIFVEIRRETPFFQCLLPTLEKSVKIRGKIEEILQIFCPKYRFFVQNLTVQNFD